MFTAAFLILFVLSVGSLVFTIDQIQKKTKQEPVKPKVIFLAILALLSCVLAYSSDFKYYRVALVYMLATLVLDWAYADWLASTKLFSTKQERSKKWLRWQLFDNSTWVILTVILFVG